MLVGGGRKWEEVEFCELASVNEKIINLMVFIGFCRFLVFSSLCLVVFMNWVGVLALAPNLSCWSSVWASGLCWKEKGIGKVGSFFFLEGVK